MIDRLSFALYRGLALLLRLLPLKLVWWCGFALGTVAYYLGSPYRRLARQNLHIAFGAENPPADLRRLARQHFQTLGANLFSSIKLPTMTKDELLACVRVEGLEHMDAQVEAGGGFLFAISHLGNWEMFGQITPYVYRCKVGTIYQALGNPHIDAEVRRDRARLGLRLFERKEGFAEAAKFMREGGAVGVLMDQHAGDAGVWCPFFNRLASTTTLPAMLAIRTGAWIIPAAVYSDGPARWRCVLLPRVPPLKNDVTLTTVALNRVLEQQIRQSAADWFWVHNRWKTPKPKFLLQSYKRGVVLPPDTTAASLQPFRIVIRSPNWLGDAVMTIPAVQAIKRGRPDAHVTILTPAKLADLWRTVREVDALLEFSRSDTVFSVGRKLAGQFEAAVVFPNSLRTGLEVWLAGIPRRVGYPGHRREWCLNQVLREKAKKSKNSKKPQKAKPPQHQVYHYLRLAEFIGAELSDAPALPEPASGFTTERPLRLGLIAGAEYGPAKRWLPERFAEVIRTTQQQHGLEWTLFGVDKDRLITERIVEQAGVPVRDLVGKTSLAELIAELRRCDAVLTNDTGTMHVAAWLGVPVVAIFGSTEPTLTGPIDPSGRPGSPEHTILRAQAECSPCFLRECPIDFRCMKRIEVDQVVAAIETRLGLTSGVHHDTPLTSAPAEHASRPATEV